LIIIVGCSATLAHASSREPLPDGDADFAPPRPGDPSCAAIPAQRSRAPSGDFFVKLHASVPAASNVFTSYGDGYVEVNAVRFDHSIVVMADRPVSTWDAAAFDALAVAHFERIAAMGPELVLFGSGARLRFPHPRLLAPLHARGIGVETMDVQAACRTYNILVAEGRRAAAALVLGPPGVT